VLALAVPSVVPSARERGLGLPLALLGTYLVMHVVAFGSPRFRLPFLPLLFLLAARTLSLGWRGVLRAHGRPLDRALLAALAAALAACVGASARETFSHPAFRDGAGPRRAAVLRPAAPRATASTRPPGAAPRQRARAGLRARLAREEGAEGAARLSPAGRRAGSDTAPAAP
jgi:hypothetical protein